MGWGSEGEYIFLDFSCRLFTLSLLVFNMVSWWDWRAVGGRGSLVLESVQILGLSGSYWTDLASSQKYDFLSLAPVTKVYCWGHPLVSAGLGDSPPGLLVIWLSLGSHMTELGVSVLGCCPRCFLQKLLPYVFFYRVVAMIGSHISSIHPWLHLFGVFGISEGLLGM